MSDPRGGFKESVAPRILHRGMHVDGVIGMARVSWLISLMGWGQSQNARSCKSPAGPSA